MYHHSPHLDMQHSANKLLALILDMKFYNVGTLNSGLREVR